MALQSALAVQVTRLSCWVVVTGPHRRELPVLGQISESEAFLLRDLAAGWSWLCEVALQNHRVFLPLSVDFMLFTHNKYHPAMIPSARRTAHSPLPE